METAGWVTRLTGMLNKRGLGLDSVQPVDPVDRPLGLCGAEAFLDPFTCTADEQPTLHLPSY